MYFTGNDGYQNFLSFAPMLSSLVSDSNKKVTNSVSIRISPEKIKPIEGNLEPTIPNLANARIKLKFSNSVIVQKHFFSLYSGFILNLYIVCELNIWPRNRIKNFTLFGIVKLIRNAGKNKLAYNGRGIAFDGKCFSSFNNGNARNVYFWC